jgi:hypothetical protein
LLLGQLFFQGAPMPFTQEEMARAGKLLDRLEKNAKSWRKARWLVLGAGIVTLGVAIWGLVMVQGMIQEDWGRIVAHAPSTQPQNLVMRAELETEMLGLRFDTLVQQIFWLDFVGFMAMGALGAGSICVAIGNWNKNTRDRLFVGMARAYLEQQKGPGGGPRPGSEAAPEG